MSKTLRQYLSSDKIYRSLKAFLHLVFPLFIAVDFGLNVILGVKIAVYLIGIVAIAATIVGFIMYKSSPAVGDIVVIENGKGGKMYSLELDDDHSFEELEGEAIVSFRIRR